MRTEQSRYFSEPTEDGVNAAMVRSFVVRFTRSTTVSFALMGMALGNGVVSQPAHAAARASAVTGSAFLPASERQSSSNT